MQLLLGLIVIVASASAAFAPNYATCVEVENLTGNIVDAQVLYSNGEVATAQIQPDALLVFDEKVVDQGSYTSANPVLSLTVTADRPFVGPLTVNHDIVVNGVQRCVRRQVKNNFGGFYIQ